MFDVKHIAKLARLGLTEKELSKIKKELSLIFDYFNELNKVDTSDVKPTSHPHFLENVLREDVARKQFPETAERLIKMAPETRGRHIKVKSVL